MPANADDSPIARADLAAALAATEEKLIEGMRDMQSEILRVIKGQIDIIERRTERTETSTNAILMQTAG